jgi:hypothetical protein
MPEIYAPRSMPEDEVEAWVRGDQTVIAGYTIKPKKDFGNHPHLVRGEYVSVGWVITRGGANVVPGAGWATTMKDAKRMVGALVVAKGDPEVFHGLMMLTAP